VVDQTRKHFLYLVTGRGRLRAVTGVGLGKAGLAFKRVSHDCAVIKPNGPRADTNGEYDPDVIPRRPYKKYAGRGLPGRHQ